MTRSRTSKSRASTPQRRALEAVRLMRRGKSLTRAVSLARTSTRTVRKYASEAIGDLVRGSYQPRRSDRLVREVRFLTPSGQIAVKTRSARTASLVGKYFNAVDRALRTGDARHLESFVGRSVRHGRGRVPFVTDLDVLSRLAHVGEVSFIDVYATSA